ncbi:hypothetical protein RCH21_000041 [Arthrobacter sp. PL16]|uniref:hypothetical protein n=1 Tax=Arthrobacter sp. PL16 TaxID=3071720 RepID=UPI002DFC2DAA|nr:hypothetical protein [Arthrobacter sp. PL16]
MVGIEVSHDEGQYLVPVDDEAWPGRGVYVGFGDQLHNRRNERFLFGPKRDAGSLTEVLRSQGRKFHAPTIGPVAVTRGPD